MKSLIITENSNSMGKVHNNKGIPTYQEKIGSLLQFSLEHMLKVLLFRKLH